MAGGDKSLGGRRLPGFAPLVAVVEAAHKDYGRNWGDTFFRVDVHEEEAPEEEPEPQPVEA